jgi:hypothetical protein
MAPTALNFPAGHTICDHNRRGRGGANNLSTLHPTPSNVLFPPQPNVELRGACAHVRLVEQDLSVSCMVVLRGL